MLRLLRVLVASMLFCACCNAQVKVTYLYNSGWLIETKSECILVDYVPAPAKNYDADLIKKLKAAKSAYVLITHEHDDHFYKNLLDWHKQIDGLSTVIGWDYSENSNSIKELSGRSDLQVGSLDIYSHPSTDAGSGFLVKTPGFTFYHAGDHANWDDDMIKDYSAELKFVSEKSGPLDAIFIPIVRGKRGGCKAMESITSGALLAVEKLKPRYAFPMHIQCDDLSDYKTFSQSVSRKFPSVKAIAASSPGFEFTIDKDSK